MIFLDETCLAQYMWGRASPDPTYIGFYRSFTKVLCDLSPPFMGVVLIID